MIHFHPQPATEAEQTLWGRVAFQNADSDYDSLTAEALCELTARQGIDFTTAFLHRRIVESERHGPFLQELSAAESGLAAAAANAWRYKVAIVPGAFFRENPHTGADGRVARQVASDLGLPILTAPISSTGYLAENAAALVAWLLAQEDERLILVSVSKGGSDVKTALALPEAEEAFSKVVGWINLCGILDGTPMADWLLSPSLLARANRFVYRIRGRSLNFLSDLQRFPGCPLDAELILPPHLRTIHVVGFPLREHLRNGLARRCHERLAALGPNDGSIILSDVLSWPGQLCPVWGADHYLRPQADVRPLLATLFATLLRP